MKYKVKLRRTVIQETVVEVEANDSTSAMDKAEDKYVFLKDYPKNHPGVSTIETDWVAVAVNED